MVYPKFSDDTMTGRVLIRRYRSSGDDQALMLTRENLLP